MALDPTWNSVLVLTVLVALAVATTIVMYRVLSPGIAEFEANHELTSRTKVFLKLGGPTAFFAAILSGFCYLLFYEFKPVSSQLQELTREIQAVRQTLAKYDVTLEVVEPILADYAQRQKIISEIIGNYCFTSHALVLEGRALEPAEIARTRTQGNVNLVQEESGAGLQVIGSAETPQTRYSFSSTAVAVSEDFVTYNWRSRAETSLVASGEALGYAVLDLALLRRGAEGRVQHIGGSWSAPTAQGKLELVPEHLAGSCT